MRRDSKKKGGTEWPHEFCTTKYARRIRTVSVGRLTLGMYVKNPALRPDTMVNFHGRHFSPAPADYECISLTILPASPADIEGWTGPEPDPEFEYFLALTDPSGNVILVDDLVKADADRVMELAETSGVPPGDGTDSEEW